MNPQQPPKPVEPADLEHPRAALARLAMAMAAQELADLAGVLVPTVFDESGSAMFEYVQIAARLNRMAQEVLARTVMWVRERRMEWSLISEALDAEDEDGEKTRDAYAPVLDAWEEVLNDPWELGHGIDPDTGKAALRWYSRLPSGCCQPAETAAHLDEWCTEHLGESTRRLADDDGIARQMVSARLPKHTTFTELNREMRIAAWLFGKRVPFDGPEYVAHRERRAAVHARIDAENGGTR